MIRAIRFPLRARLAAGATLLLTLVALPADAQLSQYYCFDNATTGAGYTWEIWGHDPAVVGRILYGTGTIAASAPSSDTIAFRNALIADINANMPPGWTAAIDFTDDLCPGWDTAMQVDSPNIAPVPEFHLTFRQPFVCTANAGYCDPDARVRRYVPDSFGTTIPAVTIYCLDGSSSGTRYFWGYSDGGTTNLGYESTPAAAADTAPIRNAFIQSLHVNESPPGTNIPLMAYGVTAGMVFTDDACPGEDTAFAINSPNDPIALAVTPADGGTAYVTIPLVGNVAFNPTIRKATGVFVPFPFPVPGVAAPLALGLGVLLVGLGRRALRDRRD